MEEKSEAGIHMKRNEQWKQLKGQGAGAYLRYFRDYYRIQTMVAVAVILFVVYMIVSISGHKEVGFQAIFVNAQKKSDAQEVEMEKDFAKYAGIDTGKNQVLINLSEYETPGSPIGTQYDMAVAAEVNTQISLKELDVLVADVSNFDYYVSLTSFVDLRDVLPKELLDKYSDSLYYVDLAWLKDLQKKMKNPEYEYPVVPKEQAVQAEQKSVYRRPDPSGMKEPVPVGIFADDLKKIREEKMYGETVSVLGFAQSGRRTEQAVKLLEYLDS
jgi:hypothetical protein